MHSSLIDLINIKAMLVLFSLQAKWMSLQLLQMFHLPDKIQFYAPNLQEKSKLSTLLKYNWDTLDFLQKFKFPAKKIEIIIFRVALQMQNLWNIEPPLYIGSQIWKQNWAKWKFAKKIQISRHFFEKFSGRVLQNMQNFMINTSSF